MAEVVRVEGEEYKGRNPWGAWGLLFLTLGVYYFYWHYKINDEARRYLREEAIRPGVALLAVLVGWVLIVPPYVSVYRTAERVKRMQERAGASSRIEPVLALIASFFLALNVPYVQTELNRVWDAVSSR